MKRFAKRMALAVALGSAWHSATAILITNHFDVDPGWVGVNNTVDGNSYGYIPAGTDAGGSAGEVGGTFARSPDNFYVDTNNFFGATGEVLTLTRPFEASGKFDVNNVSSFNNVVELGHRSFSSVNHTFVGLGVSEQDSTTFRARALIQRKDGVLLFSPTISFLPINGDYEFSYDYDPNGGVFGTGRLTLNLWSNSVFIATHIRDVDASDRAEGYVDAFGVGGSISPLAASVHGDVFLDDVIYTALPEPSVVALLGLGGIVLLWRRRR